MGRFSDLFSHSDVSEEPVVEEVVQEQVVEETPVPLQPAAPLKSEKRALRRSRK